MSLHSIDHDDSEVSDRAYKGYHIDNAGEVTEFYDHRNDDPAPSSFAPSSYRQPLVTSNGNTNSVAVSRPPPPSHRRARKRDAGCCNCCVSLLTTVGTLPCATAFALICSWLGTALFIGGGWKALDETLVLFLKFGPLKGNPAKDPAPEYFNTGGTFSSSYILLNDNDLGNRVPQVFEAIKYSFYAIIPFMLVFTIFIAYDNIHSSRALRGGRGCKTSSTGICCTAGLIFFTYFVILAWVFFLAFTTLGVYYYRITMMRCYDLTGRGYTDGVLKSICIDLVQMGLILFQNTVDDGFGKICGPGDDMRSYGQLDGYCDNYYPVYEYMLLAFSGCLLNIIAMVNFIMILSANYGHLTRKTMQRKQAPPSTIAASTVAATSYRSSPAPVRSVGASAAHGPPPYVVGTRDPGVLTSGDRRYSRDMDYRERRSSKDIELDYMMEGESSVGRRREMDSNVGVNYYYRH